MKKTLIIATRQSRLAIWQAEHVKKLLENLGFEINILGLSTKADKNLDLNLSQIGGKGLFTKELNDSLLNGQADLAVHCIKDMPVIYDRKFCLTSVLPADEPFDALISNKYNNLESLPKNAILGTSSLRRQMLLKQFRQDLEILPLRGNLDTRLKKLDDGIFDAIVLAAVGLNRLGLTKRIVQILKPEIMLPAVGQGVLGLEILNSREDLKEILSKLNCKKTFLRVKAERSVSFHLGGNCLVPLAIYGKFLENNLFNLKAIFAKNIKFPVSAEETFQIFTIQEAESLGKRVANQILKKIN